MSLLLFTHFLTRWSGLDWILVLFWCSYLLLNVFLFIDHVAKLCQMASVTQANVCFRDALGLRSCEWGHHWMKPTPVSGMKTHNLNNLLCLCIFVLRSWQSASRNSSNWKMTCLYRALFWYTVVSWCSLTVVHDERDLLRFGCSRKKMFFFFPQQNWCFFPFPMISICLSFTPCCQVFF